MHLLRRRDALFHAPDGGASEAQHGVVGDRYLAGGGIDRETTAGDGNLDITVALNEHPAVSDVVDPQLNAATGPVPEDVLLQRQVEQLAEERGGVHRQPALGAGAGLPKYLHTWARSVVAVSTCTGPPTACA
ncbi:MAG: hypothetical protein ACR2J0_00030, partial [Mycobacteriales bacterium]